MHDATLRRSDCGSVLDLLKIHIGLDPDSACADNVPAALAALGVAEAAALAHYVQAARLDMARLEPLVTRIVVHETWFMREPAAFDVLVCDALRAVAAGRRYRVLSVPCSTGEEPYSIVLALVAAGVPRAAIDVLAVDISARAVDQARRGAFGTLAFRGVTPAWRDTHFVRAGAHWQLADRFEDVIRFDVGNLMALPTGSLQDSFDAVFCRNLLIYLDTPARTRVFKTLRLLARHDSGLIFVGHAESTDAFDQALERVAHPMSFAFHNRARRRVRPATLPSPVRAGPAAVRVETPAPAPAARLRPVAAPIDADPLAAVRALADRGELAQALAACEHAVRTAPQSADARALRGVLAVATGQPALAHESFVEALYLDPAHASSLHHLMLMAVDANDVDGARRLRERLQRAQAGASTEKRP